MLITIEVPNELGIQMVESLVYRGHLTDETNEVDAPAILGKHYASGLEYAHKNTPSYLRRVLRGTHSIIHPRTPTIPHESQADRRERIVQNIDRLYRTAIMFVPKDCRQALADRAEEMIRNVRTEVSDL